MKNTASTERLDSSQVSALVTIVRSLLLANKLVRSNRLQITESIRASSNTRIKVVASSCTIVLYRKTGHFIARIIRAIIRNRWIVFTFSKARQKRIYGWISRGLISLEPTSEIICVLRIFHYRIRSMNEIENFSIVARTPYETITSN